MRRHEMSRFRPNGRRNTGTLRQLLKLGRGIHYSRDCRTYTLFGGGCGWGLMDLTKAILFNIARLLVKSPCRHSSNFFVEGSPFSG